MYASKSIFVGAACGVVALLLPVEPLGLNLTDGQGSLQKPKNPDKKELVNDMEENETSPPISEERF